MKSSTLGDWKHRLRFIDWFGILNACPDANSSFFTSVNLGFGWTTSGEHHVIGSPSGTFSNISSFTPWSSQSLSGFCRWYGTGRGFWATGLRWDPFLAWLLSSCLYSCPESNRSLGIHRWFRSVLLQRVLRCLRSFNSQLIGFFKCSFRIDFEHSKLQHCTLA